MTKKVIVDYRTDPEVIKELNRLGFDAVKTMPVKALYYEVNGHSDMQFHFTGSKAICAPEVYSYYKKLLPGIDIILGSKKIGPKYPYDIAYNTCVIGDHVICRCEYTADEILSEYSDKQIVDTKQGYAKCSICVVNDNSAITSDNGLYKLMKKKGLNVLKISPCGIKLYGMTGFIGGASGLLDKDLLAFNGDLTTHRDHSNITAFCRDAGVNTVSLSRNELADIGSIIRI